MKESVFEKKFIERLKKLPHSWWPKKVDALSVRGLPDRIGCVNGRLCALEFKKDEGEARRKTGRIVLQHYVLGRIERAGGYAAVVFPENADFVFMELESIARQS